MLATFNSHFWSQDLILAQVGHDPTLLLRLASVWKSSLPELPKY